MTTTVKAGICLLPHGTHFVSRILLMFPMSLNHWEITAFFSPVLMFIFSSPVPAPRVSHGGWRMGENVCVCVFPSHRNTLNCSVFSVCEHRRIRSQLTAHRPTKTLCFCLFLTANHSYTLNNFWLCLCSQSVPFSSHSAICCALVLEWSNNYCDNRGPLPLSTLFSLTPPTPKDFLTA